MTPIPRPSTARYLAEARLFIDMSKGEPETADVEEAITKHLEAEGFSGPRRYTPATRIPATPAFIGAVTAVEVSARRIA
jgi:hypothetical protein